MKRRMDKWNHDDEPIGKRVGHDHFLRPDSDSDDSDQFFNDSDSNNNLDQQIQSLKSQISKFSFKTGHSAKSSVNSASSASSRSSETNFASASGIKHSVRSSSASAQATSSHIDEPEERAFDDYRQAISDFNVDDPHQDKLKHQESAARAQSGSQEITRLKQVAGSKASHPNSTHKSKSANYGRAKHNLTFQAIRRRFDRQRKQHHVHHTRHTDQNKASHRQYGDHDSYYDHHPITWYLTAIIIIILLGGGVLYYQQAQDRKIIEKTYHDRENIKGTRSSNSSASQPDATRTNAENTVRRVYGRVNSLVGSTNAANSAGANHPIATDFAGGVANPSFKHLDNWCNQVNSAHATNQMTVQRIVPRNVTARRQADQVKVNYSVILEYLATENGNSNLNTGANRNGVASGQNYRIKRGRFQATLKRQARSLLITNVKSERNDPNALQMGLNQ